jgi:hypothetical protein
METPCNSLAPVFGAEIGGQKKGLITPDGKTFRPYMDHARFIEQEPQITAYTRNRGTMCENIISLL